SERQKRHLDDLLPLRAGLGWLAIVQLDAQADPAGVGGGGHEQKTGKRCAAQSILLSATMAFPYAVGATEHIELSIADQDEHELSGA
ncbi:MAG TPA: hypothetical protein VF062_00185, partial [Candidatus Limnocylindrales bacterium]